mmetsp:Transcript_3896/g.15107  ORF Transcript_3896/g.15107 Transcript_3896/m.15107 type:complete len:153 (-) Transcript_3896:284-742(-)|eukprot:scaffold1516_cov230-Pinguiococcus_pyrenoidosus.AAC.8
MNKHLPRLSPDQQNDLTFADEENPAGAAMLREERKDAANADLNVRRRLAPVPPAADDDAQQSPEQAEHQEHRASHRSESQRQDDALWMIFYILVAVVLWVLMGTASTVQELVEPTPLTFLALPVFNVVPNALYSAFIFVMWRLFMIAVKYLQ